MKRKGTGKGIMAIGSLRTDGITTYMKFRETTKSGKWLQFKGEIGAYSIKDSKLLWTYPFDYRNSSAYCTKARMSSISCIPMSFRMTRSISLPTVNRWPALIKR